MSKNKANLSVLFVGGFRLAQSGSVGGQLFACRSLIGSDLKNTVDWVLIDTSSDRSGNVGMFRRMIQAVGRLLTLLRYLLFRRTDIVLIFSSYGLGLYEKGIMALMAKFFRKPVIFAPRSGLILEEANRSERMRKFLRRIIHKVDVWMCQSEFWKNYYQSLSQEENEKFSIRENWLDVETYVENRPEYQSQNSDHHLKVLFLGRIDHNKGIYDLVEAAHSLKSQFHTVTYLIAGMGPELDAVKSRVNDLGMKDHFEFLHWVNAEEKMKWLQQTDVYVLLSYFEGYPNALIEAMASGLPVLATSVGSVSDIIEDGENGFLVQPGDTETMAERLLALYQNPGLRKQLADNARTSVMDRNRIGGAVQFFEELFEKLTPDTSNQA